MYEARVVGVSRIVAPMIETPYALSKFLAAVNSAFPKDEQEEVDFAVNIETVSAYRCFDEMLTMPEIGILDGIVVGRVDLSGSLGLSRNHINGEEVFGITKELAAKAKSRGFGGSNWWRCVGGFIIIFPCVTKRTPGPIRNS